jgi:hypothetical protein
MLMKMPRFERKPILLAIAGHLMMNFETIEKLH